jgi:lipopolysaccharide export system protein LptA
MNSLLRTVQLLVLFMCAAGRLQAQQDTTLVILDHADSLVGREVDGQRVKELFGNVKLHQGTVIVTCRHATQFLASKKIMLEGEVEVLDSTMRMVAERGVYDANEREAEAFDRVHVEDRLTTLSSDYGKYFVKEKKAFFRGNVFVQDTATTMTAEEVTYFREDEHNTARGSVVIRNPENRMIMSGGHFENFRKQGYSKMLENPRVVQVDTPATGVWDTLTVTSLVMESFQDSFPRVIATDSVRLFRKDFAAEAGSCIFFTKADSMILRRSPYIWYTSDTVQENQIAGDSIFLKLSKRKLERVAVEGRARVISRADERFPNRFNQMTGQEIIMAFKESKLIRVDVDKTATSLYYAFDGLKPNGVNKISGDHVTITLRDGRVAKLKVVTGVEGQYFPEKLIRKKEMQYNLQGFTWRLDRPGKP